MSHPIVYPVSLPGPSEAPIQSTERRLMSEGYESRSAQRDRLATQEIVIPVFTAAQRAEFDTWYEVTLVNGAAWFASSWPMPQGGLGVRRFTGPPRFTFIPGGYWRMTATCELRGAGEMPHIPQCVHAVEALHLAKEQALYVYEAYYGNMFVTSQEGVYYPRPDSGGGPPWVFPVTIDWVALAEPPAVTVFSGTRNGASPQAVAANLLVTGATAEYRKCRACVFQTYGGWGAFDIIVPGSGNHAATHYPDSVGGAGFWAAHFLLINNRGSISAEFI